MIVYFFTSNTIIYLLIKVIDNTIIYNLNFLEKDFYNKQY